MNISIIIPSIRPHYWEGLCDSIEKSCQKNEFEIIFVGPFLDQKTLDKRKNVRHILSYRQPTSCFHEGIAAAKYDYLYFTSDDSLLYPDALDRCIEQYLRNCRRQDLLNCRYREGDGMGKEEFNMNYWLAKTYPHDFSFKYIDLNWQLVLQTIVDKGFFIHLGGFDCRFEFSNHAHHDFSFRAQKSGSRIFHSVCEIANLEHLTPPNEHKSVEDAQLRHDFQIFAYIWSTEPDRGRIDFDNYLWFPEVWSRRFKAKYTNYEQMCKGEDYGVIDLSK